MLLNKISFQLQYVLESKLLHSNRINSRNEGRKDQRFDRVQSRSVVERPHQAEGRGSVESVADDEDVEEGPHDREEEDGPEVGQEVAVV